MSRKENIKKALGISVYPWSSDDDEEQDSSQIGTDMINNRQQQSPIDSPLRPETPGPNVQSSQAQSGANGSSRRRNQMLWSRNSSRVEVPQLSVMSRESSGSGLVPPAASGYTGPLPRVLAFNRIHNSYPNHRTLTRPLCSALGSSRGLTFSQQSTLSSHVDAIVRARRLARSFNTYDRTLNAAVIGDNSSLYARTRRPTPEDNTPVNVDQSDDDVELTEPADRNEGNMETEAPEAGEGEAEDVPLAEGNNEEEQITSAENDDQINDNENNAENETEPQPGTSSAPDNPTPQVKRGTKRRKDHDEENAEPITVKEFNQNLLRLLECPVCLEWMEPPMSQCRRGHLVCGRCRARLASCPVCRTAFSSVRNRAMEGVAEMVRYPCRHGCGREVRLRSRAPHEASCLARRYRCPAPSCHHRAALPRRELATHLQDKHPQMVRLGWKHKISTKLSEERHENWVIMAMHELFHLRLDVDIRTWSLLIYVAYIGPKCNASQYTYEVTIVGKHNRKMSYARSTHCDLECSTLNVGRQDCFHLTLEQAINFLRDSNKNGDHEKYLMIDIQLAWLHVSESNDDEGS